MFSAYCVVAKESVPKHVSLAFLERLKTDFRKRYGGGKADTAMAKSLTKEFGFVTRRPSTFVFILPFFKKTKKKTLKNHPFLFSFYDYLQSFDAAQL